MPKWVIGLMFLNVIYEGNQPNTRVGVCLYVGIVFLSQLMWSLSVPPENAHSKAIGHVKCVVIGVVCIARVNMHSSHLVSNPVVTLKYTRIFSKLMRGICWE